MVAPPDIRAMLARLAAMNAADRDFVLAALGPETESRLLPLLEKLGQIELSASLQTLIEEAGGDDPPPGMTSRGMTALRQAGEAAERERRPAGTHAGAARESGMLGAIRLLLGSRT